MESNNCISCGKLFSSLKNPGNKRSLSSKLVRIDRTVKDVLQKDLGVNFTPEQKKKRFLCPQCSWIISSFAKSQEASAQALKKIKETAHASHGPTYLAKKLRSPMITPRKIKKLRTVSPQKPQQAPSETGESTSHTLDVQTKKKKKLTKAEVDVNRALTYLRLRQYRRGLKLLMSTRSGALKAFSTLLKETVQEEMGIFLRQSESKFGARKGIEEWREFQWNDFLDEMKVHCPLLTSCLLGAQKRQ
ncbi:uncharacterized protein LOC134249022 [Saccostrea cucullata]|uniref:uncharacterized protein LOC134249022 n=1 Tax=Saccostrea cuccullata TaxID=36930 RepID=UPI002ED65D5D